MARIEYLRVRNYPEYRRAVDDFFTRVRDAGLRTVVLDVRRNTGGNSEVLNAFLNYLPAEQVREYGLEKRLSWALLRQRGLGQLFTSFRVKPAAYRTPHPALPDLVFRGRVYALISGRAFSSGNWIAVTLQGDGLATVVGEPAGNAPTSFGDVLNFTLPGVPTTVEDVRRGRDPQLEWVQAQAAACGAGTGDGADKGAEVR